MTQNNSNHIAGRHFDPIARWTCPFSKVGHDIISILHNQMQQLKKGRGSAMTIDPSDESIGLSNGEFVVNFPAAVEFELDTSIGFSLAASRTSGIVRCTLDY